MEKLKDLPNIGSNKMAEYCCPKCKDMLILSSRQMRGYSSGVCHNCDTYHHSGPNKNIIARFNGIKQRCYDPKSKEYKYYGAIGVTICDEWLDNRNTFVDWALSNGYSPEKQIDKDIKCKQQNISPSIYSPDTCMWVSATTNSGFTRKLIATNSSGFRGVSEDKNTKRFTATIMYDNKSTTIGSFYKTAIEAAVAYDTEAIRQDNIRQINDITDSDRLTVTNITNRRKSLTKEYTSISKSIKSITSEIDKLNSKLKTLNVDKTVCTDESTSANSILKHLEDKYL